MSSTAPTRPAAPVDWRISDDLVPYPDALAFMERRVADIRAGTAGETVWLLEHPPLYTAGTSAKAGDLLSAGGFPVYEAGRGGQYTYHGPGQRIGYVMLDVAARGGDLHDFVWRLEEWVIRTLDQFAVKGERRCGRVGVWVDMAPYGRPGLEAKIAALGVRVRRGVSFHGVALNVEPNLDHFCGIVPCGIREHGVTSLADLGHMVAMAEVDMALRAAFRSVFEGEADALTPACRAVAG